MTRYVILHFDCPLLRFTVRNVILNIKTLAFSTKMDCFDTSTTIISYTANFFMPTLRRQQIIYSFTGHVPVPTFFFRAPSLDASIVVLQLYKIQSKISQTLRCYVTPWLVNLPRRLVLDQKQKVQCLATTDTSYLADVFFCLMSLSFVYPHNFNHFLRLN